MLSIGKSLKEKNEMKEKNNAKEPDLAAQRVVCLDDALVDCWVESVPPRQSKSCVEKRKFLQGVVRHTVKSQGNNVFKIVSFLRAIYRHNFGPLRRAQGVPWGKGGKAKSDKKVPGKYREKGKGRTGKSGLPEDCNHGSETPRCGSP